MSERVEHEVPVLSTTDRGGRMTQLAPGQPVGRLDVGLALRALVCLALWAAASSVPYMGVLGITPTAPVLRWLASPWGLLPAVLLAGVAFTQTSVLRDRARYGFGQPRVAGMLVSLTVTGGFAVGAAAWAVVSFRAAPSPPFEFTNIATATDLPRELAVLIGGVFGAWTIVTLIRLPSALWHARSRQQTLARLRESGTPFPGVLSEVRFSNHWVWDEPFFTVQVEYGTEGERKVVAGHMRTTADRVPVVGTRMIVRSDGRGATSLELDPDAETVFEDEARYRAPEG